MSEPEPDTVASPRTFPCRKCGADLRFKPGTSSLACPHCGTANEIENSGVAAIELDYHAHLATLAREAPTQERRVLKCGACAAEVEKAVHITALDCPFCGSALVAEAAARIVIKPGWLLPFHVPADEARAAYRQWLGKLWFAPSNLKQYARQQDRLQGIYLPFWTYDAEVTSRYTGMRGDHYYVTVGSGKNKRRVRRTRWFPASGSVFNTFNDVLVVATRTLPADDLDALAPWDLGNLVEHADDYIAGFGAESYQVDLEEGFRIAAEVMDGEIRVSVRRDIGGDAQQIHTLDHTWHEVTFKHILLPVWVTAYRYKDKVYRVMVNARTGEVRGQRPWSAWKIALTVMAGLALILAVVFFANR